MSGQRFVRLMMMPFSTEKASAGRPANMGMAVGPLPVRRTAASTCLIRERRTVDLPLPDGDRIGEDLRERAVLRHGELLARKLGEPLGHERVAVVRRERAEVRDRARAYQGVADDGVELGAELLHLRHRNAPASGDWVCPGRGPISPSCGSLCPGAHPGAYLGAFLLLPRLGLAAQPANELIRVAQLHLAPRNFVLERRHLLHRLLRGTGGRDGMLAGERFAEVHAGMPAAAARASPRGR